MPILAALIAGLLFGAGLALSGMMDPTRVLGFLDLTGIPAGRWDPSLAFVMAGGLAVALPAFALSRHFAKPMAAEGFQGPSSIAIDRPLLLGSAIFGIGWGLVGYCPGPAIASLGSATSTALPFVFAMVVGMAARNWLAGPTGTIAGASRRG